MGRDGVLRYKEILRAKIILQQTPLLFVPGALQHLLIAQSGKQEGGLLLFDFSESRDGVRLVASEEADQDRRIYDDQRRPFRRALWS